MKTTAQEFIGDEAMDAADLMDALDELDLDKDQDWQNGTTTWHFDDGSKIVVDGCEYSAQ